MSLKIRLARGGSKHRPYYNVVIADSRFARDGRFIEKIGAYNPLLAKTDEKRWTIDLEKAKEWLKKGATPTDRVARHLASAGLVKWEASNNPQRAERHAPPPRRPSAPRSSAGWISCSPR